MHHFRKDPRRSASGAVARRREDRLRFRSIIELGLFWFDDSVACLVSAELLPQSALIFTAYRKDDRWIIKLRLGKAVLEGINLNNLGVTEFDPAFRRGWNAGANKRGGGNPFCPEEYAQKLCHAYKEKIKELSLNRDDVL